MKESMKSEWKTQKLGDIFLIERGGSPRPISKFITTEENGINWIKIGDTEINSQYITKTAQKIKPEGLKKSRLVNEGDFLLSNSMSFGRPYISKITGAIHDGWLVLRNKEKNIDKDFFYYLLSSPIVSKQFHTLALGSTVQNLNTRLVSNVEVSYPSIEEQKRIVSILDDVFMDAENVLKISKNNLEKTKATFDSILENIFNNPGDNWVETNLGSIAKIKGGKRVPRGYQMLSERTNHPYIRVSDFNENGSVNMSDLKYIDDNIYDQIKNYTITDKDMYISIAGTIGKTGIVPSELNGANLTENASKLVFEKDVYNKYVYFFTRSKSFLEQAGLNTRTTAMPKLALTRLASIHLKIPESYKEQVDMSTRINDINEELLKLNKIYAQKIDYTSLLKKSVLNKAFAGEL